MTAYLAAALVLTSASLLYQPIPVQNERMQKRLQQMEALLLAGRWDEGRTAVDAFVRKHKATEWAPAAIVLLGRHLTEAERYEEAVEVLTRAHRMYGCAARDQARELRRQAELVLHRQREAARRDRKLTEALAATTPKEELPPDEEIRRQNECAKALLSRAATEDGDEFTRESVSYLERLVAECRDSGYRPFAELALPIARWGGPFEVELRRAPDDVVEPMGTGFEAVAEKYSCSIIGHAAGVMIASLLYMMGDLRGAYEAGKPLLDYKPPDPEPYPLSAEALKKTDWHIGPYLEPTYDAQALMEAVTGDLIGRAFRQTDLQLVRELAHLAQQVHQEGGDVWWVKTCLDYFGDEPEALRSFAPLYALQYTSGRFPASASEIERLAMEVVAKHPQSKAAPAALWCALRTLPSPGQNAAAAEAAERLRSLLATKYPDSIENLAAQINSLTRGKRYDDALAVFARLNEMRTDAGASEAVKAYVRDVSRNMHNPAESRRWHEKRIAQLRQQYGAWLERAGLDDDYLAEYPDTSAVVQELIGRLPENEVDIIATTSDHPAPRGTDLDALGRRPREELALELLWRRADADSLLALLAAGPRAPHFDEAVERWRVVMYRDRLHTPDPVAYYRELADKHRGTPAEALALDAVARTYLQDERPEQALDFLNAALRRIGRERLFQDHLLATRKIARRQIAAKRKARMELLWEFTPAPGDARFYGQEPVVADGRLYVQGSVGSAQDEVLCLDAETGELLWRRDAGDVVTMRLVGGRLFVGTRRGQLICLGAATGERLWEKRLPGAASEPTWCDAGEGIVVAHVGRGPLYALNASSGEVLWDRRGDLADRSPTILDDIVTTWDRDGVLRARRLIDGTQMWAWDLDSLALQEDEGRYGDPELAAPTIRRGEVLTFDAYRYRTLTALDPVTGHVLWTERLRMIPDAKLRGAACDEARIVLAGRDITIACDTFDGSFLWAAPLLRGRAYMDEPIARAGDLLFRAMWDGVLVLDLRLGAVVATLGGARQPTGMAAKQTRDGVRLYCVEFHSVKAWHIRLPRY